MAPIKSTTNKLTSRSVLPFRSCFAGSLQFPSSTVKQTKLFYFNFGGFFPFITRKTPWGTQQIFIWGGSATRSNLLIFFYSTFHVKGTPFVYFLLTNATPFPWASIKPGTWNIPEHAGTFRNIPEHEKI